MSRGGRLRPVTRMGPAARAAPAPLAGAQARAAGRPSRDRPSESRQAVRVGAEQGAGRGRDVSAVPGFRMPAAARGPHAAGRRTCGGAAITPPYLRRTITGVCGTRHFDTPSAARFTCGRTRSVQNRQRTKRGKGPRETKVQERHRGQGRRTGQKRRWGQERQRAKFGAAVKKGNGFKRGKRGLREAGVKRGLLGSRVVQGRERHSS